MKKREFMRLTALCMASVIALSSLAGCGNRNTDFAPSVGADSEACTADVARGDESINFSAPAGQAPASSSASAGANGARREAASEATTPASSNAGANAACDVVEESACYDEDYTGYEYEYEVASDDCYDGAYSKSNGERYEYDLENGYSLVAQNPLSTFAADVDTASYANVRRMVEEGYGMYEIDPAAVREEEFINYFSYDLVKPKLGEKFGITTQLAKCPWNEEHELMMVGMTTKDIDLEKRPSSNFVFLLDVSGSMGDEDKLPLLQKSFSQLVDNLNKHDRVSIVTYANGVNVVLQNARGDEKEKIKSAINSLSAGGGTNGEGGIQLAYKLAEDNLIKKGNNRIILATDGDLNIGISEPEELEKLISKKKESGVYLSVLGFGTGNLRDDNMERLADKGNGNYAYIDSIFEAKKVLVQEMGATLNTVAKDVKLQVEFNPERVSGYRLIGYENRMMAAQDFYDDTKDAGEIGAGHQVVALYEIIPARTNDGIELKYASQKKQTETRGTEENYENEYATVKVAYKQPNSNKSEMVSKVVRMNDFVKDGEKNIHFAAMVAEYAMLLSDSQYKGSSSMEGILESYQELKDGSEFWDEYKEEFIYLVKTMSRRM